MESASALHDSRSSLRRDLLTALLIGGMAAGGLVVMTLLVRRVTGALVQPLGGSSLVAATGLGLLLATGWRLGWLARGKLESTLSHLALAIPGFALFLLLCVFSLPETANWALMLGWLGFFTVEAVWWWMAYSQLRPIVRRPQQQSAVGNAFSAGMESAEAPLPPEVFQQVTRTREGANQRIAASIRISFSAGQRVAVEHVAFCPPLHGTPRLVAQTVDGPDARVSLTSVQPFGIRLEVRLDDLPEEACEVVVMVGGSG